MRIILFYLLLSLWSQVCGGAQKSDNQQGILDTEQDSSRKQESDKMASALILVAEGSEDIEAITCVDVLRRAGIKVVVAATEVGEDGAVRFSNDTRVIPDKKVADVKSEEYDVVVLPGGRTGAENLRKSADVKEILDIQKEKKKLIAAICASPQIVLQELNILGNLEATGYPGFIPTNTKEGNVVQSENIITSRGPGTAMEFAMHIVEKVISVEKREELEKAMLIQK